MSIPSAVDAVSAVRRGRGPARAAIDDAPRVRRSMMHPASTLVTRGRDGIEDEDAINEEDTAPKPYVDEEAVNEEDTAPKPYVDVIADINI